MIKNINVNYFLVLKFLVTLFFLYVLDFNFSTISSIYYKSNHNLSLLCTIILIGFFSLLIAIYRWHQILKILNFEIQFFKLTIVSLISHLFSQILPSSLSGDLIKIVYLKNYANVYYKNSFQSIILDRYYGILALYMIFLLSFLFLNNDLLLLFKIDHLNYSYIFYLPLVLQFLGFYSFKYFNLNIKFKFLTYLISINFYPFLISILVQFLLILEFYYISILLNTRVDFLLHCLIVPVVLISSIIPISIGGWGIREFLTVYLFGFFGINSDKALEMSILFGLIRIILSIPGLFILIFKK